MKTSEKIIERKLVEAVKEKGGLCIKLLSDYFTGLPDRLCLFPGQKAIFVELKTTGADFFSQFLFFVLCSQIFYILCSCFIRSLSA